MQAHLLITGTVQGIGYRQFVKSHARKMGITGWVKNLPDGSVEAILQGDTAKIEEMITLCKKGPFLAEVKDVEVLWEEATSTFDSFTILV
ncbi:MAG TPA: acylphosphatase [Candidatus Saccharimonadales bacterium]|nr:acylphosphatase [Candidatus Saccharimonadales bacterium]